MKYVLLLLSALLLTFSKSVNAQDENNIDAQFEQIIEKSNSYQTYKVIQKTDLNRLQKNVKDSIASLKNNLREAKQEIGVKRKRIDSISNNVVALENELEETYAKVESIEILGIQTHKTAYNSIMWSVIGILFVLSLILFFIYKRGNNRTKNAQERLLEVESELDALRKRSLEKEQVLRRELQDEINKNRLRKE